MRGSYSVDIYDLYSTYIFYVMYRIKLNIQNLDMLVSNLGAALGTIKVSPNTLKILK
jgi:hypothetical protein